MNDRQRSHILEIQPFLLIAAALIVYIVLISVSYGNLLGRITRVRSEWTEIASEQIDEKYVTRYTAALPEENESVDSVCFYTEYAEVRAWLNDAQVYRFDKPRGERFSSAAPSIWNKIILPVHTKNAFITVEITTPYRQYANPGLNAYFGAESDIERFLLIQTFSRFAAALGIMFIGIIFCIVALILRFHHVLGNRGMYSLCMFIVVLAVYMASKQTYLLLNMYDGVAYNLIRGISFMMCPVMYSRYMMRQYKGVRRLIAAIIHVISIASAVILSLLHLLHVWELPESMIITTVICVVTAVYALVLELSQYSRRLVIPLSTALTLFSVMEYYRIGDITWAVYLGLFLYIFIVIYRIVTSVISARAREIRLETALDVSRSEIATIQITSHFFYHTLDSIRALIRLDADRAYKMTGDFAKYVRYRVDGVEQMAQTVPFSKELRAIRAYTDIKKAQLGERFRIEFDVETEDFEILPLTIQPLVENSVIHAVQLRRGGGLVRVVCREEKDGYHIEVIDNGPGAQIEAQPRDDQKRHTAIENVNTRLEYYGIPPIRYSDNDLGGKTAYIVYPKHIKSKGLQQ